MNKECNQVLDWPCTFQGSEEFFGMDVGPFLEEEGDVFDSITWTLPNGLTSLVETVKGTVAYIKIRAVYAGKHIVRFALTSTEGTDTQTHLGKITLHVDEY